MNVTIGQYYPADSFVHQLDPRVKLLGVTLFIAALFTVNSFAGYAFIAVCMGLAIYATKVPPIFMLRGLRALIFILIFTSALNIFFTAGNTVLVSFWVITITLEGILNAIRMVSRLTMLIVGSSVLTLTTTPIKLTDAIEYVLGPFKRIGVPAHEIAMMMSIALRFIPTLLEEIDRIMKAQMARGADFDTGGLIKKAKSLVPLLVPLFISAFRRADELAVAMEARCYRGDINRTKMKVMRLERRDFKALWVMLVFSAAIVLLKIYI
ncbi:MAG: energy-coupling factor transporter transmembrane protein EcfT [Defluviitaleaceae bacterium]|nr:energy-coupling factor transporter transmembrane protein EcfT [Defluviitaleaceae bacterium]MCL2835688.1 energy-coupling factor transporter transmembrane protein EcfT [Defluviitaleaceae bacterium]